MRKDLQQLTLWTVAAASAVYGIGWAINVMDVDASQYASMSREMLERGNYLQVTDRGNDYLDKPPLIFWTSTLSMSLFGINNIAYRIPAFLATLLALYSTFRLATIYNSKVTGLLAVCILATTQAVFLINHDVRTDTLLMCWFAFTMWQLAAYLQTGRALNFVLAFTGIGLAMLAKGPIGLIAPAMGVFMHTLLKKDWRNMFSVKWFASLPILALILLPMAYGLYTQFDMHPEKVVNGATGVSGIRFFFWTQSFGRITGESIWTNDVGPFFLSHSTLWAFAPWSLFLVLGLFREVRGIYKHLMGTVRKKEFLIFFGFLLPFMALSSSRYQLPHYAFVVYPLGAIMASRYIVANYYRRLSAPLRRLYGSHIALMILLLTFVFGVIVYAFPNRIVFTSFLTLVALLTIALVSYQYKQHKLVLNTVITAVFINLMLNFIFYPEILRYQFGSELGRKAAESGLRKGALYKYGNSWPYSLDFYAQSSVISEQNLDSLTSRKDIWVVAPEKSMGDFRVKRPDLTVLHEAYDYPVTQLTMEFLNPKTRLNNLTKYYLIKL